MSLYGTYFSGWQGREAIVSYTSIMCQALDSHNGLDGIVLSPNGSEASGNLAGEALERRRTHTRSVVIVTMNREKCGRWIQICENIL